MKCHTEDKSPKYRMVSKIYQCLTNVDKRLRNKCAMTDYGHAELVSASCGLNPSPAFQAPSPQVARGKIRIVEDMKENNSTDKVYSLFTTPHLLRKTAFTLAEVLVTLGIIGVVSAMTVPTLMQNYQRQSYVTQLHKTYNEFSQAILRFQTDRNAVNLTEAGLTSQEVCNNLMTSYFKTTQTCENSLTPCFADSYKTLQGGTIDFDINTSYVLASGASVRFMYAQVGNGINKIANITVDVNGKKGPNILGRDLFWMALYNDGVIDDYDYKSPAPLSESLRNDAYDTYCQGSGVVPGYGCFGRILNNNWEMNY